MAAGHEDVSFKAIDGLVLRGWLYSASSFGAAIIITPGLLCVKEMFVPQIAEAFQKAGVTALVYDPRHLGESEGQPRNEVDPSKQVSDYSDALSFLAAQAVVDHKRIAFWGMSFSATVALCAASLDKRASLCIAACPFLNIRPPSEKISLVLGKCMADRESRHAGNPPTYLPMLTRKGTNPAGLPLRPTAEELELILTAQQRGAANFDNRCTLETYYHFQSWTPEDIVQHLAPTPVLFLVPGQDTWSPPEQQLALYETISSSKNLRIISDKGHLTLFHGEEFSELMQTQIEFLQKGFALRSE